MSADTSQNQAGEGRRGPSLAVFLLLLTAATAYLGAVLPVFGPRMQEYFGITNRQLGTLLSCAMMGGIVGLPLVGPASAWLTTRRVVELALLGAGAGMLLCGIAPSLVTFEASLVITGFFVAILYVGATTLLVAVYPQMKRRMVAVTLAASLLPNIVLPPLAQRALAFIPPGDSAGFSALLRLPTGIVGALLIAATVALSRFRCDLTADLGERAAPLRLRQLLSGSSLLIVALAALHSGSDSALSIWMPKFMTSSFTHLPVSPGVVLSFFAVAYVVSRSVQAALPEGFGQRAFLTLAGPLGGAVLLAAIWRGDALGVALLYPLAAFLWSVEFPSLLAEIRSTSSAHFSSVMAVAQLAGMAAAVGQLNLIGWLVDYSGSGRLALTPAACGYILFGLLAAFGGLGRARDGSNSDQ